MDISEVKAYIFHHLSYERQVAIRIKNTKAEKKENDYKDVFFLRKNRNAKEKYVVIRMDYPLHGLFSVINLYLFSAEWLSEKGYIPVLDYEYVDCIENNEVGDNDILNRIFVNDVKTKDLKGKLWVLVDDYAIQKKSNKIAVFLNNSPTDFSIRIKNDLGWRDYYKRTSSVFYKHFKFSDSFVNEVKCEVIDRFIKGKTVGVIMRESFSKRSHKTYNGKMNDEIFKHEPCVPDIESIIALLKIKMNEWEIEKCFVSTMMSETVTTFEKEFGESIIVVDRTRRSYKKCLEINKKINESSGDLYKSMLRIGGVGYDQYNSDIYCYMKECLAASMCDYLIAVKCSGTVGALMLNGGKYREVVICEDYNNSVFF